MSLLDDALNNPVNWSQYNKPAQFRPVPPQTNNGGGSDGLGGVLSGLMKGVTNGILGPSTNPTSPSDAVAPPSTTIGQNLPSSPTDITQAPPVNVATMPEPSQQQPEYSNQFKTTTPSFQAPSLQAQLPEQELQQLPEPSHNEALPPNLSSAFNYASRVTGVPYSYLQRTAQIESGFNPSAASPNSSASGLFQFTKDTWNKMVQKYGSQFGIGPNDINNPQAQAVMAGQLAKNNAGAIKVGLGIDPNQTDLYMAHFLGGAGAAKFLKGYFVNRDAPVSSVVSPAALQANKSVFYNDGKELTIGDVYNNFNKKFNSSPDQIMLNNAKDAFNATNSSIPNNPHPGAPQLDGGTAMAPEFQQSPAFQQAQYSYQLAQKQGLVKSPVMAVVDFSKPASDKRLWVVNTQTGKVLMNTYVAHGKNSGDLMATKFSNNPGSLQSSLGTFVTDTTYDGNHGLSLRIKGLEPGINDKAYGRDVVVHGAKYIGNGKTGRSFGCFAVPEQDAKQFINLMQGGALINAYAPDPSYNQNSQFVNRSTSL